MARSGYITVNQNIDVDVDIDVEELFEECTDEQLIKELKERDYSVSDKCKESYVNNLDNGECLKRFLCDLFNMSYYQSTDLIIRELKERIK